MKKILITGKNSYIGNSFKKYIERNYSSNYSIEKISVRDDSWKEHDFSTYDCILHVAGIAHVSSDPKMENLYYKINRDLTVKLAKKAKAAGVKQFIFLSSIIVYGDSSSINEKRVITRNTYPRPSNFYGRSKLQAEDGINHLQSDEFNIVIIRLPMIYGKGSKGNYQKLAKSAKTLPIFPDIDNERSMIHIDNLCEFIRLMIKNDESGLFFPQNSEYIKTTDLVIQIKRVHNKNIKVTKIFNPFIKVMSSKVNVINKVFGSLVYEKKMSEYKEKYHVKEFKETVEATESWKHYDV
ncbi:NAD-dependent epimerase/dehydratase family protein [Evansella sp. AB-P1]|uniref:NAD-dependent epimerase/dehydratase family protein n=1 Tax=Evansella sp. AB-P1 TaxID=3037653 RepID=UPI00241CCAD2|nr:NAD-dependent epimerase/dehydratase family protein [Evansella sp. AB-P1]MDG5789301.1 NAD-dependent epimerase/dehydratase family protein [Evansella sp. AB-P1]